MRRLPKKLCNSNSSKAWLNHPTPNHTSETPVRITLTVKTRPTGGKAEALPDSGQGRDHHLKAIEPHSSFREAISPVPTAITISSGIAMILRL
jgi:hypothetical protein